MRITQDFLDDVNAQIQHKFKIGRESHELSVLNERYFIPDKTTHTDSVLKEVFEQYIAQHSQHRNLYEAYYENYMKPSQIADTLGFTTSFASSCIRDIPAAVAQLWIESKTNEAKELACKRLEETLSSELLQTSVSEIGLSIRCTRALKYNGCETVKDLLLMTGNDFRGCRNIARGHMVEAIEACQRLTGSKHMDAFLQSHTKYSDRIKDAINFVAWTQRDNYQAYMEQTEKKEAPHLNDMIANAEARSHKSGAPGGRSGPAGPGGNTPGSGITEREL